MNSSLSLSGRLTATKHIVPIRNTYFISFVKNIRNFLTKSKQEKPLGSYIVVNPSSFFTYSHTNSISVSEVEWISVTFSHGVHAAYSQEQNIVGHHWRLPFRFFRKTNVFASIYLRFVV